jgi:HlyD family secretion protein
VADLDRATAALAVAQRGLEQAQFAYREAVSGYTREDLGIAQSKVEAAQAGVETLNSLVEQMVVVAPADSQAFRIPIEDGEFVLPGIPLICDAGCARSVATGRAPASPFAVTVIMPAPR